MSIDPSTPITIANIQMFLEQGWKQLNAYIDSLSTEQLTVPTDAGGWTVKDHLVNLMVWENGIVALLNHQNRAEAMGFTDAEWSSDNNTINEIIRAQHLQKSASQVIAELRDVHGKMVDSINRMSDSDLVRPYRDFAPDSDNQNPIFGSIAGNTFGHYEEHLPWMRAISDKHPQAQ